MIVEIRQDSLSLCCQLRAVRCDRIAAALIIRLESGILIFEHDWLIRNIGSSELICKIQLSRCSALDADIRAFQCIESSGWIIYNVSERHDRLAVIESDRTKGQTKLSVTGVRPGTVAAQDIHLTGLQSRKAVLCTDRKKFDSIGVIEQRGCPGAAEINIKTRPGTIGIQKAEALECAVHATNNTAAI